MLLLERIVPFVSCLSVIRVLENKDTLPNVMNQGNMPMDFFSCFLYREEHDPRKTRLLLSFPYLSFPYLTLPYLTLPYLTLPYLFFFTFSFFSSSNTIILFVFQPKHKQPRPCDEIRDSPPQTWTSTTQSPLIRSAIDPRSPHPPPPL